MKSKDDFFERGSFMVGNGEETPFSGETWGYVSLPTISLPV
jgi:hypothetical protein